MSIEVKLHPVLQKLAGGQEVIEVTGHTTGECLRNLESRFPSIKQEIRNKRGRLRPYYCILVNSKHAHPKQLTTPVKDGDEVEIRIVAVGG
jgi:molybdopterin converting factor small subunit